MRASHDGACIKEQIRLFSCGETDAESGFCDPAFAGNKSLPVHRWVPWIAGFSARFVQNAMKQYLHGKGTVLDPFCGVGTTLVEAALQGHDAIGFEINPYAALASRAKTGAARVGAALLQEEISRYREFYAEREHDGYRPRSLPPKGFRTRAPFYSPAVLRKVLLFHDFLDTLSEPSVRDLFRLAFASTMVQFSNYSYEPSLGRRASAGKQEVDDYPVNHVIARKLDDMERDIRWMQEHMRSPRPSMKVIQRSFFEYREHLGPDTVDLVITSPPYLNNYHYNRNTRPQLYWLGFVERPQDLQGLERDNFGKFWQTVREYPCLDLDFELPGSDIKERLATLRGLHPEKGVYGGKGWANYAAAYFNDCRRFAEGIRYALRPGGHALVVIGNSILQGVLIPTDRYFAEIAELVGLELVRIH
ncbi:MAG: DNA methyltransferase, partial [Anaerolineae bacterium]|nr:DNA methyltransferase [Anaerolineae bacterium]